LAENGGRVLLCDVDPQHSLSSTFLDDVYAVNPNIKDLLYDADTSAEDAVSRTRFQNIDIIPSNLELGAVEIELREDPDWQYLLNDKLDPIRSQYSCVLIDCPPSLGTFTRLALVASDYVIIPLECSRYAVKSTMFILDEIERSKKRANPPLEILGFLINRIHTRRRLEQDYRELIREQFGDRVFKTEFKNSVKYAEAVTLGLPVTFYVPKSEQAEAYRDLLKEMQRKIA
jgi:chromosome partitioning protein